MIMNLMNKPKSLGFSIDTKNSSSTSDGIDSFKRRKSKISIQMDELLNKLREKEQAEIYDEVDDLSEFGDDELRISNNSQNSFIQFKQFNVYCYFNINKDISFIFPIKTDLFNINKQYIYELIKNVVKKVNNEKIVITYHERACRH
jgi:hypothetical protein